VTVEPLVLSVAIEREAPAGQASAIKSVLAHYGIGADVNSLTESRGSGAMPWVIEICRRPDRRVLQVVREHLRQNGCGRPLLAGSGMDQGAVDGQRHGSDPHTTISSKDELADPADPMAVPPGERM
jgi:hypothetical protein